MSRLKRRMKIYLVIFLVLLAVAVLLPAIMRVISDYFGSDETYYYPHDLQRDEYLDERNE